MVGLPGSGKSTWLNRQGIRGISTDDIRDILSGDPTNQTIHKHVFTVVRYLVRQRLAIGMANTFIDATHLTRKERQPYLQIADWYGCHVDALFFPVPLEECLRRNSLRERMVPPEAIRIMAGKLEVPELGEGFDRVSRV